MTAPGVLTDYPLNPYIINVGNKTDHFGWRAFNLSKQDLLRYCAVIGTSVWYTDGREFGSYAGFPDTGWMVSGGDPTIEPADWPGFFGYIGYEIYLGGPRQKNQIDHHLLTLLTCIVPEPGTMLLIGSALLLLIRRKK